jgi:hypothetical protein
MNYSQSINSIYNYNKAIKIYQYYYSNNNTSLAQTAETEIKLLQIQDVTSKKLYKEYNK